MFKKPYHSKLRFGGKPSGRKFGGGGSSWNRGSREGGFDRPAMHSATCHTCRNECQVPFKPNGSKPVFCNNCFDRNGAPAKSFGGDRERSFSTEKRMFKTDCDKCGTSCEVPFRPNGSKPVYCKDCFSGSAAPLDRPRADRSVPSDMSAQLTSIHQKLDAIMEALND